MPNQQEIVGAVCGILRQLYTLTECGLAPNRINRIYRETIFFLYEGGDANKWAIDRPHSASARILRIEAQQNGVTFNSSKYRITYDHAIPLSILHDDLRPLVNDPAEMGRFLDRHVQGVIILNSENALLNQRGLRLRMPNHCAADDLMARYRECGIEFEGHDLEALERNRLR